MVDVRIQRTDVDVAATSHTGAAGSTALEPMKPGRTMDVRARVPSLTVMLVCLLIQHGISVSWPTPHATRPEGTSVLVVACDTAVGPGHGCALSTSDTGADTNNDIPSVVGGRCKSSQLPTPNTFSRGWCSDAREVTSPDVETRANVR
jgi:hypothetical protein